MFLSICRRFFCRPFCWLESQMLTVRESAFAPEPEPEPELPQAVIETADAAMTAASTSAENFFITNSSCKLLSICTICAPRFYFTTTYYILLWGNVIKTFLYVISLRDFLVFGVIFRQTIDFAAGLLPIIHSHILIISVQSANDFSPLKYTIHRLSNCKCWQFRLCWYLKNAEYMRFSWTHQEKRAARLQAWKIPYHRSIYYLITFWHICITLHYAIF